MSATDLHRALRAVDSEPDGDLPLAPSGSSLEDLLVAWEAWDARPKDEHTADTFHRAVKTWATGHGLDPVKVRQQMSAARRGEPLVDPVSPTGRDVVDTHLEWLTTQPERAAVLATIAGAGR